MPNQSGKIILILILILLVAGATAYFFLPAFKKQNYPEPVPISSLVNTQNSPEASKSPKLMDYYSKALKISFKVPAETQIEEKPAILKLILKEGSVSVTRNETTYDNLEGYLSFYDSKRNLKVLNEETLNLGRYEAAKRDIEYVNKNQPSGVDVYIYIDHYVYIFSTSDESLYPTLDQIVQSFEYKP